MNRKRNCLRSQTQAFVSPGAGVGSAGTSLHFTTHCRTLLPSLPALPALPALPSLPSLHLLPSLYLPAWERNHQRHQTAPTVIRPGTKSYALVLPEFSAIGYAGYICNLQRVYRNFTNGAMVRGRSAQGSLRRNSQVASINRLQKTAFTKHARSAKVAPRLPPRCRTLICVTRD